MRIGFPVYTRLRTMGGVLCLLWLAACAHVNHLRDAQETFSRTAEAENRMANAARDDLFRSSATGANDAGQISAGYTAALLSLDKLEQDSEAVAKLKSDRLYGNVLALRAMIYWRLQKYDKAAEEAKKALASDIEKGSRDFALMMALPGLVASDQARAQILASTQENIPLDSIFAKLNTADAILCDADRSVAANHPVRVYLGVSALAVLRNAQEACDRKHGGTLAEAEKCFKGDVNRDERATEYFKRLKDLGAPDSALSTFMQGVTMTPATKTYCPRQ